MSAFRHNGGLHHCELLRVPPLPFPSAPFGHCRMCGESITQAHPRYLSFCAPCYDDLQACANPARYLPALIERQNGRCAACLARLLRVIPGSVRLHEGHSYTAIKVEPVAQVLRKYPIARVWHTVRDPLELLTYYRIGNAHALCPPCAKAFLNHERAVTMRGQSALDREAQIVRGIERKKRAIIAKREREVRHAAWQAKQEAFAAKREAKAARRQLKAIAKAGNVVRLDAPATPTPTAQPTKRQRVPISGRAGRYSRVVGATGAKVPE